MRNLREAIIHAIKSNCYGDRCDADCAVLGAEEAADEIMAEIASRWEPIAAAPRDGTWILVLWQNSIVQTRWADGQWAGIGDISDADGWMLLQ